MSDDLARLDAVKRRGNPPAAGASLGAEAAALFHGQIERRHTKLGTVAEAWAAVVPEPLQRHTCLDSVARGRLTVLVDSAAHLYELRQLMLAGLEKQLLSAARGSGVRRVSLKRGRWYDDDGNDCF